MIIISVDVQLLKNIYHLLLDQIYPHTCFICRVLLQHHTAVVCQACLAGFNPVPKENRLSHLIVHSGIDAAYAGWYYEKGLVNLIHSLKYNDMAKLGRTLGQLLGQVINQQLLGPIDIISAVPLHRVKYRERGYNQAAWIAKGIAEVWSVPVHNNILKKNKYTISQTTLKKAERQKNMLTAFTVVNPVEGQAIALVDDVITTGSTISACAVTLKTAGAARIVALTVSTPVVVEV